MHHDSFVDWREIGGPEGQDGGEEWESPGGRKYEARENLVKRNSNSLERGTQRTCCGNVSLSQGIPLPCVSDSFL